MKYKWLLFDADGTLFDYNRAEEKALQAAFNEIKHPFQPQYAEVYGRVNRQVWDDFERDRISAVELRTRRFELLFQQVEVSADASQFSAIYLQYLAQGTDLMPGAEELIQVLREKCHLAIITNGLHDIQRPRLNKSKIAGMFEVVAISEELGAAKPSTAFFDKVFQQIGHPDKTGVLVIGDSLSSDIQGGYRYSLDTCWFNPEGAAPDPRFPPTYEIRELNQIYDVL